MNKPNFYQNLRALQILLKSLSFSKAFVTSISAIYFWQNNLVFSLSPQGGVSKLNEATALVDDLKKKAAEQSKLLTEKQAEADAALKGITQSMQVSGWMLF